MTRLATLALFVAALWITPAFAQDAYPSKPIKLVVPFPPGGSTDVIARLLAKPLGDRLRQTIVIENKAGAGTVIGADAVAKAAPDGYTLLLSAATTYTVNPVVLKRLPYDPQNSFEPLGIVGSTPLVLLAHPSVKATTLKELAAQAKTLPNLTYGSFGNGTTAHFAGEMLFAALGIQALHVPYKGSAPAMTDLIGGQIPLSVDTVVAAAPQVKAGKVKALAVTSPQRSHMLPSTPTAVESGYPSVVLTTWFAIVAPKGLAEPARASLEKVIAETMKDKAVRDSLVANGYEPEYETPAAYRMRVVKEVERLRPIAAASKISAD